MVTDFDEARLHSEPVWRYSTWFLNEKLFMVHAISVGHFLYPKHNLKHLYLFGDDRFGHDVHYKEII